MSFHDMYDSTPFKRNILFTFISVADPHLQAVGLTVKCIVSNAILKYNITFYELKGTKIMEKNYRAGNFGYCRLSINAPIRVDGSVGWRSELNFWSQTQQLCH